MRILLLKMLAFEEKHRCTADELFQLKEFNLLLSSKELLKKNTNVISLSLDWNTVKEEEESKTK